MAERRSASIVPDIDPLYEIVGQVGAILIRVDRDDDPIVPKQIDDQSVYLVIDDFGAGESTVSPMSRRPTSKPLSATWSRASTQIRFAPSPSTQPSIGPTTSQPVSPVRSVAASVQTTTTSLR